MSEGNEILVLRDEAGAPFLMPKKVVELEELVAFSVGQDEYLLPRKKLLDAKVSEEASRSSTEAMSVRAHDGTNFLLSTEMLEDARVKSDEERAAAGNVLDADVVAHAPLDFEISPLGEQEIGMASRGFGYDFVS